MKYLLILFSLISFAYAQEPAYTPMRLSYQFRSIKVDSLFLVPSFVDTTAANSSTMKNVAGAMIRCGNDFWMRNATTNAWLQNVNTGDGASPSVEIITDISRKPLTDTIQVTKSLGLDETPQFAFRDRGFDTLRRRNDSVFAVRWGVEVLQFKDSAGLGDSPDRINGTATTKVAADMATENIEFTNFTKFALSGDTVQLIPDHLSTASLSYNIRGGTSKGMDIKGDSFRIEIKKSSVSSQTISTFDSTGNINLGINNEKANIDISQTDSTIYFKTADPITWQDKANDLKSQVKTGYADNNIDLSSASYIIKVPGIYIISTADATNSISLPDAALFKGQSVQIVNTDGGTDAILVTQGAATIKNKGLGSAINKVDATFMAIFYSDGTDWYGFQL